jgi:hypothetical protein
MSYFGGTDGLMKETGDDNQTNMSSSHALVEMHPSFHDNKDKPISHVLSTQITFRKQESHLLST